MANGAFNFKNNSGNIVSFISGSGSDIIISGGTLDLSGMSGLTLGNLTMEGTVETASFAPSYLLTSSFNTYSGTTNTVIGTLQISTGSLNSFTSSTSGRLNSIEGVTGSYATTGSNTFNGNLTVTGYIDAQELRTTYISSSILYRSGSTKFGDELTDTHAFTGSILLSGSLITTGNMGVGTNNPLSKFHVNTGTNQNFRVRPGTDVGATNGVALNSRTDDDGSLQQLTLRASDVIMLPSGNVGIGTATPSYPLEVFINSSTTYATSSRGNVFRVYNSNTSANVFAGIELGGAGTANDGLAGINGVVTGSGNGALTFYTRNSNTFLEKMRINSDGNVGIGTSDPQSVLNNFSTSARGLAISNSYPFLGLNDTDGGNFYIGTQGNLAYLWNGGTDAMIFATNNTERMRISSGGHVGIKITPNSGWGSAMAALQIGTGGVIDNWTGTDSVLSVGVNYYDNGSGAQIRLYAKGASKIGFSQNVISFSNVGADSAGSTITWAERMSINADGNLRINNFTTNGLVGTNSSGTLGVVNLTYTEIATGTISYSNNSGASWGINNSFPATIRNYEDDAMAGSAGVATNLNLNRGVTFDLGSAKAVRKIVERGYGTKNLDTIQVQYSTDNSNWTTIHTYRHVYGNTQKDMEFNPTGAISARYWRWLIDGWTEREVQNYYTYESIIYT